MSQRKQIFIITAKRLEMPLWSPLECRIDFLILLWDLLTMYCRLKKLADGLDTGSKSLLMSMVKLGGHKPHGT